MFEMSPGSFEKRASGVELDPRTFYMSARETVSKVESYSHCCFDCNFFSLFDFLPHEYFLTLRFEVP